ncbi:MAG: hypothetical protein M1818_000023 [Claussenomyces sp. TS43310]|nr:MAG: hypothetical protein M1818_000023 [Claussenomyces sp. TS43310]
MDQQFSFSGGQAQAQASVEANLKGRVAVDSSSGLTIIETLACLPDLSNYYLYFKNKVQIAATITLDAVASISYISGHIKIPGSNILGGWRTVGPNIAVYASADAAICVAGHLEADLTIVKWEIQQTYPQTASYPVDQIDEHDYSGTQTVEVPTFEASVTATGEIILHRKPEVTFGIVFESRWKLSSPALLGWGGQQQTPVATNRRKQLTPETDPAAETITSRLIRRAEPENLLSDETALALKCHSDARDEYTDMVSPIGAAYIPDLMKRTDTFSLGPLITVPSGFLSRPLDATAMNGTCPLCRSTSTSSKNRQDDGSDPDGLSEMARLWMP